MNCAAVCAMRILIDTNVLFSALLFPRSKPALALIHAVEHHHVVLCERNVSELREILQRKAVRYLAAAEELLATMAYELIPEEERTSERIRDAKDQPILNAAIASNVDVILTGDKDFLSLAIVRPTCMTAADFLMHEGIEA